MRYSPLSVALAAALASTSWTAAAADNSSEIAELKAQLAALTAKVAELEERSDAQSGVNIDTAAQLDKLTSGSTVVETKGGIKVTSADKNFEATVGGRIHFDAYAFDRDIVDVTGGSEFRRGRLTLTGKAFGWDYKVEQDFSAGTNLDGLREAYIAKAALGGRFIIGHGKPWRSMDELTSSNETLMMERPFSSSSGLFNGRQFAQGVAYIHGNASSNYTAGFSLFNVRNAVAARNEGIGWTARATYAPINNDNNTLHFGGWFSSENLNKGSSTVSAVANYAGRRGPSQTIATVTGASGDKVLAYALEAAGSFGPVFFQSEYVNANFGAPLGKDQDIRTFYVEGGWLLNGGHKVYKPALGVFGAPKVGDDGLWELTARYDTIENKDILNREASSFVLGVNYYVNPNLRFMFNYTQGHNKTNGDKTGQYATRMQFGW